MPPIVHSLILLATLVVAAAEPTDKDYLRAVLPDDLVRYGGVEVPAQQNIAIRKDRAGSYLEFRLVPGQELKNKGIRAEISVNYPFAEGDVVRYRWQMRMPKDFQADEPANRWWVMGQWHDQPDRRAGETWDAFPSHSPPVSFQYARRDGRDVLALVVGSPKMTTRGYVPIRRGVWEKLDVVIRWSRGQEGTVAVYPNGAKQPLLVAAGPNMHNGYQHYLKLGMYRDRAIATENRLDIREVRIEKLPAWPEGEPPHGTER